MKEYQQKVIEEKNELNEKIKNLTHFIAYSDTFPDLHEDERVRLRWQLLYMEKYVTILIDRINNF